MRPTNLQVAFTESAKFDRLVLMKATFQWQAVIEIPPDFEGPRQFDEMIGSLGAMAENGHIPLGGAKTQSSGWVKWTCEVHEARAGQVS